MLDLISVFFERRAIARAMHRDEKLLLEVISDGKTTKKEIFAEFETRNGYVPINGNILFGLVISGQITSTDEMGIRLSSAAPEWARERAKKAA